MSPTVTSCNSINPSKVVLMHVHWPLLRAETAVRICSYTSRQEKHTQQEVNSSINLTQHHENKCAAWSFPSSNLESGVRARAMVLLWYPYLSCDHVFAASEQKKIVPADKKYIRKCKANMWTSARGGGCALQMNIRCTLVMIRVSLHHFCLNSKEIYWFSSHYILHQCEWMMITMMLALFVGGVGPINWGFQVPFIWNFIVFCSVCLLNTLLCKYNPIQGQIKQR